MSSAILYLAIVAIWAGFLVPAWVRRPHASKTGSEGEADLDETGYEEDSFDEAGDEYSEAEYDAERAEFTLEAEHATDTGNDEEPDLQAGIHAEVDGHEQEYRDDVPSQAATPRSGRDARIVTSRPPDARRPAPQVPQSRQQMMRARRRMLTILVGLTLGTVAFTMLGVVSWWICVPPAGMLVLYVLLLREIAMAEAELARKRQAQSLQAARDARRHAIRAAAAERAAAAQAEEEAQPGAQIIDISGRVGDQLYDQYADATVRAVGD